jgi:large subunit ribosomal protein L23
LKRPIITEKTTAMSAENKYVFEVVKEANKIELTKAFELAYPGRKVSDVRVLKIPARTKRYGRRQGVVPEGRKAIFTIVGEPLEFVTGV